jgi:hypothetical protein
MAQLQLVLTQDDLIAAISIWATTKGHQMDATTPPQVLGNGTVVINLNS